jgi:hypothetical protein
MIQTTRHQHLEGWFFTEFGVNANDFGELKETLSRRGVNSRGWRLYLDYGDALFLPLGRAWIDPENHPLSAPHNAIAWLRLLQACEMDVLPPVQLVRSVAAWKVPGVRLERIPPLFLRAAWKACIEAEYRLGRLRPFVRDEIIPVARWFFESGAYLKAEESQLKAGWNWLARRWAEANPASLDAPPAAAPDLRWRPAVRRVEWRMWRFEALDTPEALWAEGEAMRHCIADYGERLLPEMLIAYSVRHRRSGERIATLTVRETAPGAWMIDDIRGPDNAAVSEDVVQAAHAVVQALEDAYREVKVVRRFIDDLRELADKAPLSRTPCGLIGEIFDDHSGIPF